jgi:hypothetical protein
VSRLISLLPITITTGPQGGKKKGKKINFEVLDLIMISAYPCVQRRFVGRLEEVHGAHIRTGTFFFWSGRSSPNDERHRNLNHLLASLLTKFHFDLIPPVAETKFKPFRLFQYKVSQIILFTTIQWRTKP